MSQKCLERRGWKFRYFITFDAWLNLQRRERAIKFRHVKMNGPLLLKLDSVQEYNITHMQVQQWKKDHVLFSIRSNNGVPFIMASRRNGIIQIHSQIWPDQPLKFGKRAWYLKTVFFVDEIIWTVKMDLYDSFILSRYIKCNASRYSKYIDPSILIAEVCNYYP